MKRLILILLYPLKRLVAHLTFIPQPPDTVALVRRRAVEESAIFIDANLSEALLFTRREQLWKHALSKRELEGLILEFGVWRGHSINAIARIVKPKRVIGFDSFQGLLEEWKGTDAPRGAFDLSGHLPRVDKNVDLVAGWFDKTLPEFLESDSSLVSFAHLDADTYESTALVLELLGDRIVPGTVVVFDEFHGYPNWKNGERKAWEEFCHSQGLSYVFIGFSALEAAIQVTQSGEGLQS